MYNYSLLTYYYFKGKSTFLKALSGRLRIGSKLKRDGNIYYNEEPIDSDKFLTQKVANYIEQEETHAATLTVEETFIYAWKSTTGGHHSYAIAIDEEAAKVLDLNDEALVRVSTQCKCCK
jgi:ABC-type multidrug transport system ATPase subunit